MNPDQNFGGPVPPPPLKPVKFGGAQAPSPPPPRTANGRALYYKLKDYSVKHEFLLVFRFVTGPVLSIQNDLEFEVI